MMRKSLILLVLILMVCSAASGQTRDDKSKTAILKVLNDQVSAWNRGDIDGFMSGYWNSPEMTFISGENVTKGWSQTLERYKRGYNTKAKMGTLSFSDLEVTVLSKNAAVVIGRFTLVRESDRPTGIFTLTMRKLKEGWRVIIDHTS